METIPRESQGDFETPAKMILSIAKDCTPDSSGRDILEKYRELVARKSQEKQKSKTPSSKRQFQNEQGGVTVGGGTNLKKFLSPEETPSRNSRVAREGPRSSQRRNGNIAGRNSTSSSTTGINIFQERNVVTGGGGGESLQQEQPLSFASLRKNRRALASKSVNVFNDVNDATNKTIPSDTTKTTTSLFKSSTTSTTGPLKKRSSTTVNSKTSKEMKERNLSRKGNVASDVNSRKEIPSRISSSSRNENVVSPVEKTVTIMETELESNQQKDAVEDTMHVYNNITTCSSNEEDVEDSVMGVDSTNSTNATRLVPYEEENDSNGDDQFLSPISKEDSPMSQRNFSRIEQDESIWVMAQGSAESPTADRSPESSVQDTTKSCRSTSIEQEDGELLSLQESSYGSTDSEDGDLGMVEEEEGDDGVLEERAVASPFERVLDDMSTPCSSVQTFSIAGKSFTFDTSQMRYTFSPQTPIPTEGSAKSNVAIVSGGSSISTNSPAGIVSSSSRSNISSNTKQSKSFKSSKPSNLKISTTDAVSMASMASMELETPTGVNATAMSINEKTGYNASVATDTFEINSIVAPSKAAVSTKSIATGTTKESPGMSKSAAASLLERNKTLVKEVRFADQTCVELSERNSAMQRDLQRMERELVEHKQDKERFQDAVLHSSQYSAKMEESRNLLKVQMEDQKASYELKLKMMKEKLEESEDRNSSLEGKLEQSTNTASNLKAQLATSHAKYDALVVEKENHSSLMEQLASSQSDSELAIQSAMEPYKKLCTQMQQQIDNLQQESEDRLATITKGTNERRQIEKERDELHLHCSELEQYILDISQSVEEAPAPATPKRQPSSSSASTPPNPTRTPTSTVLAKTLQTELQRGHEASERLYNAEKIISVTQCRLEDSARELKRSKSDNEALRVQLRKMKRGSPSMTPDATSTYLSPGSSIYTPQKNTGSSSNGKKKSKSMNNLASSHLHQELVQCQADVANEMSELDNVLVELQMLADAEDSKRATNQFQTKMALLHIIQKFAHLRKVDAFVPPSETMKSNISLLTTDDDVTPLKISTFRDEFIRLSEKLRVVKEEKTALSSAIRVAGQEKHQLETNMEVNMEVNGDVWKGSPSNQSSTTSFANSGRKSGSESSAQRYEYSIDSYGDSSQGSENLHLQIVQAEFEKEQIASEYEESKQQLEKEKSTLERRVTGLKHQLDSARSEVERFSKILTPLKNKSPSLKYPSTTSTDQEFGDEGNVDDSIIAGLQSSLKQTSLEIESLKMSYINCNERLALEGEKNKNLLTYVDELKTNLQAALNDLSMKSTQIIELNKKLSHSSDHLSKLSDSCRSLNDQIVQKEIEIESISEELAAEKERRKEAEQDMEKYQCEAKSSMEHLEQTTGLLEEKKLELGQLRVDLKNAMKDCERLKKDQMNDLNLLKAELVEKLDQIQRRQNQRRQNQDSAVVLGVSDSSISL